MAAFCVDHFSIPHSQFQTPPIASRDRCGRGWSKGYWCTFARSAGITFQCVMRRKSIDGRWLREGSIRGRWCKTVTFERWALPTSRGSSGVPKYRGNFTRSRLPSTNLFHIHHASINLPRQRGFSSQTSDMCFHPAVIDAAWEHKPAGPRLFCLIFDWVFVISRFCW